MDNGSRKIIGPQIVQHVYTHFNRRQKEMEALEEAEIFLILLIDVDWYKWKKIPEIILTIPWRFRIIRFVDSESMTASVKGHRGVGRWPRWATAYRALVNAQGRELLVQPVD